MSVYTLPLLVLICQWKWWIGFGASYLFMLSTFPAMSHFLLASWWKSWVWLGCEWSNWSNPWRFCYLVSVDWMFLVQQSSLGELVHHGKNGIIFETSQKFATAIMVWIEAVFKKKDGGFFSLQTSIWNKTQQNQYKPSIVKMPHLSNFVKGQIVVLYETGDYIQQDRSTTQYVSRDSVQSHEKVYRDMFSGKRVITRETKQVNWSRWPSYCSHNEEGSIQISSTSNNRFPKPLESTFTVKPFIITSMMLDITVTLLTRSHSFNQDTSKQRLWFSLWSPNSIWLTLMGGTMCGGSLVRSLTLIAFEAAQTPCVSHGLRCRVI